MARLDGRCESQAEEMHAEMEMARREAKAEAAGRVGGESSRAGLRRNAADCASCAKSFVQERSKYFAAVEAEVVKLALAIAARVLHREAKMDPLLLAASVRVALDKVAEDSTTVLRVPLDAVEMWREVVWFESELVAGGGR